MSFLSDFFGTVFGGSQYSSADHFLSHEEVRRLVSQAHIPVLSQDKVKEVGEALLASRHNEKISLHHMNEVLGSLVHSHTITEIDRHAVMKVFTNYFS